LSDDVSVLILYGFQAMASQKNEYRKLPGTKKGFFLGKYTLWQGRDHLLQVYARFGVEDYKRYYFDDIQAIVTRRTKSALIQNLILGFFLGLFILATISVDGGWGLFYLVVGVFVLGLLLVNMLRGPTCETRLMTAVQTETLHSLHRLKNACRAMDRLKTIIENVQGSVNPSLLAQDASRHLRDKSPQSTKDPGQMGPKATKKNPGRTR
jgi:hypothetical protein